MDGAISPRIYSATAANGHLGIWGALRNVALGDAELPSVVESRLSSGTAVPHMQG